MTRPGGLYLVRGGRAPGDEYDFTPTVERKPSVWWRVAVGVVVVAFALMCLCYVWWLFGQPENGRARPLG